MTERLFHDNPQLYRQVKEVLEKNKQERHIRGGLATRRKYNDIRELRQKKKGYD